MLKLFAGVIGLVAFGTVSEAIARDDDYQQGLKAACTDKYNHFTIAVLEDNPPFSWVTYTSDYLGDSVKVYGIGPMVFKDLLEKEGIKNIVFERMESRKDLEERALIDEQLDATIGIQYTPKLATKIQRDFVKPSFMANPIVAVFAKGKEKPLEGIKDLYGLKGGTLVKDDLMKVFPSDLALAKLKSSKEAFLRLRKGELDYVLMGFYTANMEAKKFQVENEIVISDKILRSTNLFITLSGKSNCSILRDSLNTKLKELTLDKNKMGELLFRVYSEYEEQNKGFPAL